MAVFCGKCGTKLDQATGLCPKCDVKQPKKRKRISKRGIIALVLACVLAVSGLIGSFAVTYQPEAVVHDHTQDVGVSNNSGGSDGSGNGEGLSLLNSGKKKENESNEAVMSSNVIVFAEEEAEEINKAISNIDVTNRGLYLDIAEETPFESLGVGDIFYLDGSKESPLGEPYIGKIVSVTERAGTKTYLIETPMVDEVFDVLKIDFSDVLTVEDVQSISTIEGVTVTTVNSEEDNVAALSDGSSNASGPASLANRSQTSALSTLSHRDSVQLSSSPESVTIKKGLMFDINVDLYKAFGLKTSGAGTEDVYKGVEKYQRKNGSEIEVFITETGEKYHRKNCICLKDRGIKVTLVDAVDAGYDFCMLCTPPVVVNNEDVFASSPELKLKGKVGLESLEFSLNYDWDIMNGDGLEEFDIEAKGNFLAELGLVSSISLKIGGKTTTISVPSKNVKLQGLKEKLFPLAFVQFTGATLTVVPGGNDGIRIATAAVPFTIGAILYVDINGNITVQTTVSFAFEYDFDCSYTLAENGQMVNRFEHEGDPSLKFDFKTELKGDVDAHIGGSIVCYIFNLNLAEVTVARFGAEAEGKVGIEYTREFFKVSEEGGPVQDLDTYGSAHVRLYLKLFGIDIKCKVRFNVSALDISHTIGRSFLLFDITLAEWGTKKETLYTAGLMGSTNMVAWDEPAIYYKDTIGHLIKEENGNQTILYDAGSDVGEFLTIYGIDSSYIYLTVPQGSRYKIIRVSKADGMYKEVVSDVEIPLVFDEEYMYYVSGFDSTSIVRMNRNTLQDEPFADFNQDVVALVEVNFHWSL